jgi:hypothetical protein
MFPAYEENTYYTTVFVCSFSPPNVLAGLLNILRHWSVTQFGQLWTLTNAVFQDASIRLYLIPEAEMCGEIYTYGTTTETSRAQSLERFLLVASLPN